ncbi:MAG: hypothetical protein U0167_14200 [bacterium]
MAKRLWYMVAATSMLVTVGCSTTKYVGVVALDSVERPISRRNVALDKSQTSQDCSREYERAWEQSKVRYRTVPLPAIQTTSSSFFDDDTYAIWWTADLADMWLCKKAQDEWLSPERTTALRAEEFGKLTESFVFSVGLTKEASDLDMGTYGSGGSSTAPLSESDFGGISRLMSGQGLDVRLIVGDVQIAPTSVVASEPLYSVSKDTRSAYIPGAGVLALSRTTVSFSGSCEFRFPKVDASGKPLFSEGGGQDAQLLIVTPGGRKHFFGFHVSKSGTIGGSNEPVAGAVPPLGTSPLW